MLGESQVDIQWDIPVDQKPGLYMIKYYGNSKAFMKKDITPFSGATQPFTVSASSAKKASLKKLNKWNNFLNLLNGAGNKKKNNYSI